jgi:hypothetical protein
MVSGNVEHIPGPDLPGSIISPIQPGGKVGWYLSGGPLVWNDDASM